MKARWADTPGVERVPLVPHMCRTTGHWATLNYLAWFNCCRRLSTASPNSPYVAALARRTQ